VTQSLTLAKDNQRRLQNRSFLLPFHKVAGLKVPKREIFDRSDFPDFYTIKSLRVGDLRVKIQKNFKNI
jgi:hypothetical protein